MEYRGSNTTAFKMSCGGNLWTGQCKFSTNRSGWIKGPERTRTKNLDSWSSCACLGNSTTYEFWCCSEKHSAQKSISRWRPKKKNSRRHRKAGPPRHSADILGKCCCKQLPFRAFLKRIPFARPDVVDSIHSNPPLTINIEKDEANTLRNLRNWHPKQLRGLFSPYCLRSIINSSNRGRTAS